MDKDNGKKLHIYLSQFFNENTKVIANMCPKCYEENIDVRITGVNLTFLKQIYEYTEPSYNVYTETYIDQELFRGFRKEDTANESVKNKIIQGNLQQTVKQVSERYSSIDDFNKNEFKDFHRKEIKNSSSDHKRFVKNSLRYNIYKNVNKRILKYQNIAEDTDSFCKSASPQKHSYNEQIWEDFFLKCSKAIEQETNIILKSLGEESKPSDRVEYFQPEWSSFYKASNLSPFFEAESEEQDNTAKPFHRRVECFETIPSLGASKNTKNIKEECFKDCIQSFVESKSSLNMDENAECCNYESSKKITNYRLDCNIDENIPHADLEESIKFEAVDFKKTTKLPHSFEGPADGNVNEHNLTSTSVSDGIKKSVNHLQNVELNHKFPNSKCPFLDAKKEENVPIWVPPKSPHNLIEETLYYDPWALLVATIFLNKTSCKAARPYVFWFLQDHPDPFCVLNKKPIDLERYFVNLGLQKTRSIQVWRMSHDFLYKNWKKVTELYGVGKYGDEAFRMFCLGDFNLQPTDRFLRIYKAWYMMEEKKLRVHEMNF